MFNNVNILPLFTEIQKNNHFRIDSLSYLNNTQIISIFTGENHAVQLNWHLKTQAYIMPTILFCSDHTLFTLQRMNDTLNYSRWQTNQIAWNTRITEQVDSIHY